MTIHNFHASLRLSQEQESAPFWGDVYRKAFPNLQYHYSVRNDGWAQRGGIDRVICLQSGRTVNVDEKVRQKAWDDILLEYWSDKQRKIPGWVAKDLACDYIAYAFIPTETCYLIPFLELRRAWQANRVAWVKNYRKVEAANEGYTTVSVAVPIADLFNALNDAMTIRWSA